MIVLAVAVRLGCMPTVVCSTPARHCPLSPTINKHPPSPFLPLSRAYIPTIARGKVCMRGSPRTTRDTHVNHTRT